MSDEPCTCGHAPEEHLATTLGPGTCDAGDCDCICYEPDDDNGSRWDEVTDEDTRR